MVSCCKTNYVNPNANLFYCFIDVIMIHETTENVLTEEQLSRSVASTSKTLIELTPITVRRTRKKMVSPKKSLLIYVNYSAKEHG